MFENIPTSEGKNPEIGMGDIYSIKDQLEVALESIKTDIHTKSALEEVVSRQLVSLLNHPTSSTLRSCRLGIESECSQILAADGGAEHVKYFKRQINDIFHSVN